MQLNLIASTNLSSIVSKSQVSFGGIDNLENNKKFELQDVHLLGYYVSVLF